MLKIKDFLFEGALKATSNFLECVSGTFGAPPLAFGHPLPLIPAIDAGSEQVPSCKCSLTGPCLMSLPHTSAGPFRVCLGASLSHVGPVHRLTLECKGVCFRGQPLNDEA